MRNIGKHLIVGAALFGISTQHASTHPHVYAEARLEVVINADAQVEALRHVWRFDDLFSSTVLMEFDKNQDLTLDTEELADASSVIHESLADYNYFQVIKANGNEVEMEPPVEIVADFTDNQLVLLFETKPKQLLPLKGSLSFGVYDPTFYTAIDFTEDDYLQAQNLSEGCTRQVIRPDPDEAIAQNQDTLTEAFYEDTAGRELSSIFATRLEITCGP